MSSASLAHLFHHVYGPMGYRWQRTGWQMRKPWRGSLSDWMLHLLRRSGAWSA